MSWIKRMLGFSLFSWIFEKVVDRKIKSVNETVALLSSRREAILKSSLSQSGLR